MSNKEEPKLKNPERQYGRQTGLSLIQIMTLVGVAALVVFALLSLARKELAPQVSFKSINGEQISTQSLHGKVVLVNFWATSCASCIQEMPQMVETYNKYKEKGLEFIAVAMDYDPPNYVLNYAQTRQLPFKVALDVGGVVARSFGDVKLTPTTFLIDKEGRIIKRYVGIPEFPALHKLLESALAA